MIKKFHFALLISLFFSLKTFGQTVESLKKEIKQIVSTKDALVGVSIIAENGNNIFSYNGDSHFPMQSVFKFPIALALLSEIDKGKFSLCQKINITKEELHQNTWSPIREKYPNGTTLPLSAIIKYTVSESDNIGCDILLRLLGGTNKVEDYYQAINFNDISIKATEEEMSKNWNVQFQNWTTPKAASKLLKLFYDNKKKLLSEESHNFIWKTMRETQTGKNKLRGALPKNIIVAHKTGSSGINSEGITAAENDIGIIFLPNGKHFFISVFITNSKENGATNEKIIAEIAQATWNYFIAIPK